MMKRTVPRMGPDDAPPPSTANPAQIQQAGASNMHTLAQTAQPQILGTTSMVPLGASFARARAAGPPPVVNYLKAGAVQYAAKPAPAPPRMKVNHQPPTPLAPLPLAVGRQSPGAAALPPSPAAQFQRLKVEDALSYLDQVKYKFNTQPQVYNDFLDIMKEFKSQTIDTPGVITRVSNLFKGHPQLIVGFNTFLPPGYKIEVQSNGQVSVSMPSPSGAGGVLVGVPHAPPQLVHLLPAPPSVSSAIVHNLSVSASPANTLHHISQAHQQIEAAIHHQQAKGSGPAPPHAPHTPPAPPGQPVEFNHAIEYVNKIKSRFSRQPEKYKRFLEILHAYQRGHRDLKEPQAKQQTEQEVYSQVAKLFENQDDLLTEFGQFLPDAKAVTKPQHFPHVRSPPPLQTHQSEPDRLGPAPSASPPPHALHHANISKHAGPVSAAPTPHLKRSPSFTSSTQMAAGAPAAKKCRLSTSALTGAAVRDVSYAEAAKRATLHDYSFFDRVRKALRSRHVYDNFLRCLLLYTNEIISGTELVSVAAPFLCRHPELQRWLQDLVAPPNKQGAYNNTPFAPTAPLFERDRERDRERERDNAPPVRLPLVRHDRSAPDQAMDIDLTTCKRLGTSYCALPREAAGRRCGGRTPLCKEVLNDTWVSIPAWSEDSTFVTSRKTQYEEFIYRCEDERFELDVVIETNAATIRVLEGVQKKLSRMSPEDAARHRLDDCLGGQSPTVQQRALRRIYGDKAVDIIAGLKKNPLVAVPVVLRRLKAKEEEWREAQKGFNKQWREQNEKYYLKSLDHQGINFKQNDLKAMRSKALFNELETAAATRRPPPHLVVDYTLNTRQEAIKVLRDASELLIHHARRQTAIQKAEKRRIKRLLRRFLPALFSHPPLPPSDDEEEKEEPASPDSTADVVKDEQSSSVKQEKDSSESDNNSDKGSRNNKDKENKPKNINTDGKESSNSANSVKRSSSNEEVLLKTEIKMEDDDDYRDNSSNEGRFVCSMSWYLFLRVHGALCQRLAHVRRAANALANVSANAAANAPASRLRLARHNLPADVNSPADYYNALLELVKGVLDGNMESSMLEDCAREMFGIKAYPAYTLDKLVSIAVRQLQHIVSEPWSLRCAELYSRRGTRPRHAAAALARHHHQPTLATVYGGDECKVTFELLDIGSEGGNSPNNDNSRLSPTNQSRPSTTNGDTVSLVQAWSLYTEQFSRPGGLSRAAPPVFLRRNARARGGDGTNAAPRAAAACEPRRRKPPRPRDSLECTTFNKIRMVVNRPHQLYRAGALAAARASHARLHAARRRRLRAWTSRASDL